jgi:hypothetical protein
MVFYCFLPLRLSLQLFAGSRVERLGGLTLNHVAFKANHMVQGQPYDSRSNPPSRSTLLLKLSLLLFNSSHLVTLHRFNKLYCNFGQKSVKPALLLHVYSPTRCVLIISVRVHVYVGIIHMFVSFRLHEPTTLGFR